MQIRIIKRNSNEGEAPKKQKGRRQRNIAKAVENWIADVKQKHADDRRLAFDKLFGGSLSVSKLS